MKTKSVVSFAILIASLLLFSNSNVSAQCRYVSISSANDTTAYYIPSDFPVKEITGDTTVDNTTYSTIFSLWVKEKLEISNMQLPVALLPGVSKIYIEISKTDFDLFSDERKNRIKSNPAFYHVIN